jgi:hypothetical protein
MDRFWSKVEKTDTCWNWVSAISKEGYGRFSLNGTNQLAHRVAWCLTRGEIPIGKVIDHLCRNRKCCNPNHLEIVTTQENTKRGLLGNITHCKQGHEFTEANTYVFPNGKTRQCKTCRRENLRKCRMKKKEVV